MAGKVLHPNCWMGIKADTRTKFILCILIKHINQHRNMKNKAQPATKVTENSFRQFMRMKTRRKMFPTWGWKFFCCSHAIHEKFVVRMSFYWFWIANECYSDHKWNMATNKKPRLMLQSWRKTIGNIFNWAWTCAWRSDDDTRMLQTLRLLVQHFTELQARNLFRLFKIIWTKN